MPSALSELASSLQRAASLLRAIDDIAEAEIALPAPLRGLCAVTAGELVGAAHELLQVANAHGDPPATADADGTADAG